MQCETELMLLASELEAGERELLEMEAETRDQRDEANRSFVQRWIEGRETLYS